MRGLLLSGAIGILLALSPLSLSAATAGNQANVAYASALSDGSSANATSQKKAEQPTSAKVTVAGATEKVALLSAASLIFAMAAVGARALWMENIVRSPLYDGME